MSFFDAVIFMLLRPLVSLVVYVVIANAILSWLLAFGVLNSRNSVVNTIGRFTYSVTEPLLAPFRRFIPPLGGVDISPIFLILALFFVRDWVLVRLAGLLP